MAYRMTVISVSGGYAEPNVANIAKLLADAFNQYTTATAVVATFENPYSMYPDLTELEAASHGKNYVAATTKITFLISQFEKLEKSHPYVHVICTSNYLDDIILQYIHNEIQLYAKENIMASIEELTERATSLLKYASSTAELRLPNIVIPANASPDPEKVTYNPLELKIYTNAAKSVGMMEMGDYVFPNTAIQVTAYLAFGMYNRFLETFSGGEEMYTLKGKPLPSNPFATTSANTMEFFEGFLDDPAMKINYTGNSLLTPLHGKLPETTEDIPGDEEETDEKEQDKEEMPMQDLDVDDDPSETLITDLPGEGDYIND